MRHTAVPPKKTATASAASRSMKPARRRSRRRPGLVKTLQQLLWMTFFGRLSIGVLASSLVILADLLIVSFKYDPFFKLVGIELIAAGIVFWIRFPVHTRPSGNES